MSAHVDDEILAEIEVADAVPSGTWRERKTLEAPNLSSPDDQHVRDLLLDMKAKAKGVGPVFISPRTKGRLTEVKEGFSGCVQ